MSAVLTGLWAWNVRRAIVKRAQGFHVDGHQAKMERATAGGRSANTDSTHVRISFAYTTKKNTHNRAANSQ